MNVYGLIGYPLGHSFSMRYFADKFKAEGIEACCYLNFPMESIEQLSALLEQQKELKGFNVTIPYKQAVFAYLNELSDEARAIGAVNCVKIKPEGLKGFNTDAYGFSRSLLDLIGEERPAALVLGTGGASKAVTYVLNQLGIDYCLVSRHSDRERLTYAKLTSDIIRQHRLIINATPLGTFPKIEECPDIPYDALSPDHFLFDLVYNPSVTEYLKRGSAQGARIRNGYDMLIGQAEKAWEIWNDPTL